MTIRPWFLATVSLAFVAFLLLVRDDTPFSTGERVLDDAADATVRGTKRRVTGTGRKVLGQVQKRIAKSVPVSDLAIEGIAERLEDVVKKTSGKARARRSSRGKMVV
jgi:hypothetical protein